MSESASNGSLKEIVTVFLRFGFLGFGGPIAIMAQMEEELARRKKWVSVEHFAEMYAVFKVLPGTLSTQMAIYLGQRRCGRLGGVLAGVSFILPSFLLVLGLSYLYLNSGVVGTMPSGAFSGLQAAALVVILLSTVQLSKPFWKQRGSVVIALLSAVLVGLTPSWEPLWILLFGLTGVLQVKRRNGLLLSISPAVLALFWMGFKAGAFVFGTGLAIVPMLEADAVTRYGWLTHQQFMDGLAMGQVTPGPVVITITFIGYKVAGFLGAAAATVAIFLPSFLNTLFIVPKVWRRFSNTPEAEAFSRWAIPSVVGAILAATLRLAWVTLSTPVAVVAFVVALLAAVRFRPPPWLLISSAGAIVAVFSYFYS